MIYFTFKDGNVVNWSPTEEAPQLPFGKSSAVDVQSVHRVGSWDGYEPGKDGKLYDDEVSRYITNMAKQYGWGCLHNYEKVKQEVFCDPTQAYLDVEFYICPNCNHIKDIYID